MRILNTIKCSHTENHKHEHINILFITIIIKLLLINFYYNYNNCTTKLVKVNARTNLLTSTAVTQERRL